MGTVWLVGSGYIAADCLSTHVVKTSSPVRAHDQICLASLRQLLWFIILPNP